MKELRPKHLSQASRVALACFGVLTLVLQGCGSPAAVATFADHSAKAIDSGSAVFHDLHGSCERRHLAARSVNAIFFPTALGAVITAAPVEIPQCANFASEGESLSKAAKVLTAYFRAMQQLAAFNISSVSGPGLQTGSSVAMASGLSYAQMDSVSKLTGLVMETFTGRYREHNLVEVLSRADPSITSITQGFEDIVAKDYEGLLQEEQQTLPAQYQAVADRTNPATILLLNRAFSEDEKELNRRKAAADAFIEALRQIREGHRTLLQLAKSRKPKNAALAMQTYTDRLAGLLPILAAQP